MDALFLNDWATSEEVFMDFEDTRWRDDTQHAVQNKEDVEILLASYTDETYSGYAFVLYRDKTDGKLYEVNGSHCSCYGLEGQWSPEDTTIEVLRHRLERGNLGRDYDGRNEFAEELALVLDRLEAVDSVEDNATPRT